MQSGLLSHFFGVGTSHFLEASENRRSWIGTLRTGDFDSFEGVITFFFHSEPSSFLIDFFV